MLGIPYPTRRLRARHRHQLLVRFRDEAVESAGTRILKREHPGLALLHQHDRAGRLRRFVSLHPRVQNDLSADRGARVTGGFQAAARFHRREDLLGHHARAFLVEVESRAADAVGDLRRALAADPHVEHVEIAPMRYLWAPPPRAPDGLPPTRHWNLDRIHFWAAINRKGFKNADPIPVAVLDSGVQTDHPALRHSVHRYIVSRHAAPGLGRLDLIGHGTHVSGIIAARRRRAMDPRGICQCDLRVWKIFDDEPNYDDQIKVFYYTVDMALYLQAMVDCLLQRVKVINLSLGGPAKPGRQSQERILYDDLLAQGATLVAAMGNARAAGSPASYPAALPGVVAVGAVGLDDRVAPFSSRGRHIALSAPGVSIWSTLPDYAGQIGFHPRRGVRGAPRIGAALPRNTGGDAWPGTSMATPHVTAAAALLLANRGSMSGSEVRQALMKSAGRLAGMKRNRWTPDHGAGMLDLAKLLAL
jgi:subtilisin family serine protease